MLRRLLSITVAGLLALTMLPAHAAKPRLAYIVSDVRIPFWDIMRRGIEARADALGYELTVHSAENDARRELEHTVKVLHDKVDGIILSPTNSSAASTLLKLASKAGIPVVIADIGADSGEYVSYIASDNREGSYQLGRALVSAMQSRQIGRGTVGIIAIPQKRANGKARTAGFMKALVESGYKSADIRQQVDFSHHETYRFTHELIDAHANLKALWLQGSDRYQAALDAIADAGKTGQILLVCFDAEPEFVDMIAAGKLVGAGMQQPFLMGEEAVATMHDHRTGHKVQQRKSLPVLVVTPDNIVQLLPTIRRNVLGQSIR